MTEHPSAFLVEIVPASQMWERLAACVRVTTPSDPVLEFNVRRSGDWIAVEVFPLASRQTARSTLRGWKIF